MNYARSLGCACQATPLRGLGATFSADQVVDKSLIAKKKIELKSLPNDAAKTVATVAAGQTIGVVDAYYNVAPGRTALYWGIRSNGKNYYVRHETGAFDISALKIQGAITTEQKYEEAQAEKEKENDAVSYYFKKLVLPVLAGGAVLYALTQFGTTFIKAKVSKSE